MIEKICCNLRAIILFVIAVPCWGSPIIFEFTGTVSDTTTIASNGQALSTTHPEWTGQVVTGTVTMTLNELAAPHNGPGYSQYGKNVDYPYANWLSIYIKNPDGTLLDISDSEPVTPAPRAEGDDAFTLLTHLPYGQSQFYVQRSYNNHLTYPRKHASLTLVATGENAHWLTNGADYNDVIIQPEFANQDNLGYVYHYTAANIGHEYYFKIDSLKRLATTVPEPSTMLPFIIGLLLLRWKRNSLPLIDKLKSMNKTAMVVAR